MHLHPDLWLWPQWVLIVLMLIKLLVYIGNHGRPMVDKDNQPLKYNGLVSAGTFVIWYYILSQGGFFR